MKLSSLYHNFCITHWRLIRRECNLFDHIRTVLGRHERFSRKLVLATLHGMVRSGERFELFRTVSLEKTQNGSSSEFRAKCKHVESCNWFRLEGIRRRLGWNVSVGIWKLGTKREVTEFFRCSEAMVPTLVPGKLRYRYQWSWRALEIFHSDVAFGVDIGIHFGLKWSPCSVHLLIVKREMK